MQEQIGNVVLDYKYYPGKDLYSDGAIEDELLDIVKKYPESEYNDVIAKAKSWPILYHLSHIRTNIISWYPFTGTEKVLEIGSGCGAITGALADATDHVDCIELSKKRSLINANRSKNRSNIRIHVGNFQDIEKNLTEKYDMITLIGVFEYAQGYISSSHPYEDFLKTILSHLAPGGKVLLAIENRLGLKYWAGCAEDHAGLYFEGIEGYPNTKGVRTFSKRELEHIISAAGAKQYEFYYPYPDYKFPVSIYSDDYLPKRGELHRNRMNFDRPRLKLFDESKVYDALVENEMYADYANSFLVVLKGEKE